MKRFLLRADDLGYSEAVNYGIERSAKRGLIRSVGLMPNMDAASHGVRLLDGCDLALGQHTNISVGRPLSDPGRIRSLVREDGCFKGSRDYREAGRDIVVQEEAELEIEAQYQKFKELTGREPDYFEGHAVFSGNFFKALEAVAERHGLKYSGASFDGKPFRVGRELVGGCFLPSMQGDYDPWEALCEAVGNASEEYVNLCVFHPGYLDAYLLEHSSLTVNRTKEVEMLCSQRASDFLARQQVVLVDYRDL